MFPDAPGPGEKSGRRVAGPARRARRAILTGVMGLDTMPKFRYAYTNMRSTSQGQSIAHGGGAIWQSGRPERPA